MEIAQNEFVSSKINNKHLKVITLILLFFLLYGINNVYVYYTSLMPFGISIVLSLLFVGFNGFVLGIIYLATIIFSGWGMLGILQGINVLMVLFILQWLKNKRRFHLKKWYFFLFFILSSVVYIMCSFISRLSILATVVAVVLGLLFLFAGITFLDACICRGMLDRINLDEKICGGVVLIVFSIGICAGNIYIFNLGLIFAVLMVLVINKLSNTNVTIMSASLMGIGFAIYYIDHIYISLLIIMGIVSIAFKCNCKYLSAIGIVLSYILFVLIFDLGFVLGELLSVVIGAFIFLILPNKLLDEFSNIFAKSKNVTINNIFNNGKTELVNHIKNLSLVFKEMDKVYRDMVKGNLSDDSAKMLLKDELVAGVCAECSNRDRCYRHCSYMEQCINDIVSSGYNKGKLMLIDLPEFLTTNCSKVNLIVQYFNNLINSYTDYKNAVNNVDTSRILIAEQLGGVACLLESLSNEVDINLNFNNKFEESIKERLLYAGILCLECVVYEKSTNIKIINLIVKEAHYNDKKIVKIVNKVLSSKYQISSVNNSSVAGAVDIVLSNSPNYDIVFGCSSIAKNGKIVSGDNHSVVSISDDKYMASICDGMGSGKDASNISRLTLSLIENFYKAGFDNDTILNSVNKILSLNECERFSTIDLCLIDTRKNIYDFIKLGACSGYIRRASGEVDIISSSGLPVGVLENIAPHITKKYISNMDMVVLVSDGVDDVLGDELIRFLSCCEIINPQTLSEDILHKAIDCSRGETLDDMTVVCVRVFENV